MIKELKEHYCSKAATTNNIIFDMINCLDLVNYYRTEEPNSEKVEEYLKRIKQDIDELSKTHQQEYHSFEMMRNLCLSEGCE